MDKSLKKLNVAIIGCGRISVMHLVSIDMLEDVNLVACCDVIKERADEVAEKYGCKAYYDYEEMLNNEKLDAVHVLLPHYLHTKVA
ncbi:MAG: Gfo/Idh/MocA family oxidoreductase, partial [Clostridia bacterium]|nr:Gfo/Idh/MocA family oxidoreductase [Clostridia bacterium]